MKLNKSALIATSFFCCTAAMHSQNVGTSHPEELNDSISTVPAKSHYVKPSPAVAMQAEQAAPSRNVSETSYSVAVAEVNAPASPQLQMAPQLVVRPVDPATVESRSSAPAAKEDVDGTIVEEVWAPENCLPQGTLLHIVLQSSLSTATAVRGEAFEARLTQPVERRGKVVLPEGSIVSGRIADIEGGHHFHGSASILLQPEFVTVPGGITYRMDAQVIDMSHIHNVHVSSEGAIVNNPAKGEIAGVGLTTGAAAIAGALVAGPVGAVVGGAIGAGVGTVVVLRQNVNETVPEDTTAVLMLNNPMLIEAVTRPRTPRPVPVSLSQHLGQ